MTRRLTGLSLRSFYVEVPLDEELLEVLDPMFGQSPLPVGGLLWPDWVAEVVVVVCVCAWANAREPMPATAATMARAMKE